MPAKQPGAGERRASRRTLNPAQTSTRSPRTSPPWPAARPCPLGAQVEHLGANIGLGQQLFIADCAQCHNFVGAGGALTYGKYAPPLTESTPTQIYEAMLTGPEAMPVFNDTTITPQREARHHRLRHRARGRQPNPGGFSLGRVGPVTEGLVAFLGLLLFMVLAAMWITAKHGKTRMPLMSDTHRSPTGPAGRRPDRAAAGEAAPAPGDRHAAARAGQDDARRPARAGDGEPPAPRELPADPPDLRQAKNAERVVALLFTLAFLAGVGFIAAYVGFEVHSVDAVLRSNLALGISMSVVFLALGRRAPRSGSGT